MGPIPPRGGNGTVVLDSQAGCSKVGLAIGAPSATGTTCSTTYSLNTQAGPKAQIVGTGQVGTHCVAIFDVGDLAGPVNYTITVASS